MWRTLAGLVVVLACGSNEPSTKPIPASGSAAPPAAPGADNVEDVAMRFAKAALSGDRQTAMALTLTFDEIAKLSKKAIDRQAWDDEVEDLLDKLAREGSDFEGTITGAQVLEVKSLDPATDEKVRQKLELAVVQITVKEKDGREHPAPFPWFFIKTAAGWKYSPKK